MEWYVFMVTLCWLIMSLNRVNSVFGQNKKLSTSSKLPPQDPDAESSIAAAAKGRSPSMSKAPLAGTIKTSTSEQRRTYAQAVVFGASKRAKNPKPTEGIVSKTATKNFQKRERKREQKLLTLPSNATSEEEQGQRKEPTKKEPATTISGSEKTEEKSSHHRFAETADRNISKDSVVKPDMTRSARKKMLQRQKKMMDESCVVPVLESHLGSESIAKKTDAHASTRFLNQGEKLPLQIKDRSVEINEPVIFNKTTHSQTEEQISKCDPKLGKSSENYKRGKSRPQLVDFDTSTKPDSGTRQQKITLPAFKGKLEPFQRMSKAAKSKGTVEAKQSLQRQSSEGSESLVQVSNLGSVSIIEPTSVEGKFNPNSSKEANNVALRHQSLANEALNSISYLKDDVGFSDASKAPSQASSNVEEQIASSSETRVSNSELCHSINPPKEVLNSNANTLLIISRLMGFYAVDELKYCNINLNHFGVTAVVKLLDSGIIIKCDSKEEVAKLHRAIVDRTETLNIESTYFRSLVCIHDVPLEVSGSEICNIIVHKYKQQPYKVQFLSYELFWKSNLRIALLDISSSLLAKIKESSFVLIKGSWHEIQVLLEEKSRLKPNNCTTLRCQCSQLKNAVIMSNLPKDITEKEISEEILQKFGKAPTRIEFISSSKELDEMSAKMEVDEKSLQRISSSPFVWIRFSKVELQIPSVLDQCSKCQFLGCVSKFCSSKTFPPPFEKYSNCPYSHGMTRGADNYAYPAQRMFLNTELRQQSIDNLNSSEEKLNTKGLNIHSPITSKQGFTAYIHSENTGEELRNDNLSFPGTSYPVSSEMYLADDVLLDVVHKSVETTVNKILPYIVDAVGASVQQALARRPLGRPVTTSSSEILSKNLQRKETMGCRVDIPTNSESALARRPLGRLVTTRSGEILSKTPQRKETMGCGVDIPTNSKSPKSAINKYERAVLIRPRSPVISVTQELGNIDIGSRHTILINSAIFYPSRDVLLICNSAEGANHLRFIISKSPNLTLLTWMESSHYVRINSVPKDMTTFQLSSYLFDKYKDFPQKIIFQSYKTSVEQNVKIAVLKISKSLLNKIEISPTIEIEGKLLNIDTASNLPRCFNCQLFGHIARQCRLKFCSRPQPEQKCLDCCYFNKHMRETKFCFRPRDENHQTDDELCPSKLAILSVVDDRNRNNVKSDEAFKGIGSGLSQSNMKITTNDEKVSTFPGDNVGRSKDLARDFSLMTIADSVTDENEKGQTLDEKLKNKESNKEEESSDSSDSFSIIL